MSVAKVKTTAGWQDLHVVGPAGPQGPVGPQGPSLPAPEAWIQANLSNGSHYGAPYGPVQYRKHAALGLVECRGLWVPGSGVIFVLPAGYRPTAGRELIFGCIANAALCDVRVNGDNGNVSIASAVSGWLSLSGVSFYVN